jgi:hypothetical protein
MTNARSLVSCLALGLITGFCGCGGGSADTAPPGTQGNRAPGVAAVVGVDAGMGDISNVPPASRPAAAPMAAAAESPEQAHAADSPTGDSATTTPGDAALAPTIRDPAAMIAAANAGAAPLESVPPGDGLATGAPSGQPLPPGREGVNPGGPAGQTVQKGTPEYPVVQFFNMARSGNFAEADEVISSKARGLAGAVRKGDLSDETVAAYQASFANPQVTRQRSTGTGFEFAFSTAPGETATFTVVKEGTKFVIKELKLTAKAR